QVVGVRLEKIGVRRTDAVAPLPLHLRDDVTKVVDRGARVATIERPLRLGQLAEQPVLDVLVDVEALEDRLEPGDRVGAAVGICVQAQTRSLVRAGVQVAEAERAALHALISKLAPSYNRGSSPAVPLSDSAGVRRCLIRLRGNASPRARWI